MILMKRAFPLIIISFLLIGSLLAQVDKSADNGLKSLIEKADQGDSVAIYYLAKVYDTGYDSIVPDSAVSTALYIQSAERGYPPAQNFIGFRYYNGEHVSKNIDSALYWIQKAANAGDLTAAANLAYLYEESPFINHNEEEALKWLDIAAKGGIKEAQVRLVDLMEEKWKDLPGDSALSLGLEYYNGKAPLVGIKLIEIAAKSEIPQAWALLGDAYSKGLGVVYNHQKSIDYFYKAADAGNPSAMFIIAELLEFFPDSKPSWQTTDTVQTEELEEKEASYWYQKAQESGIGDSETAYQKLLSPN